MFLDMTGLDDLHRRSVDIRARRGRVCRATIKVRARVNQDESAPEVG